MGGGREGREEGKRLFKCSVESCSNFIGYSLHHSRVYNDHKRFCIHCKNEVVILANYLVTTVACSAGKDS